MRSAMSTNSSKSARSRDTLRIYLEVTSGGVPGLAWPGLAQAGVLDWQAWAGTPGLQGRWGNMASWEIETQYIVTVNCLDRISIYNSAMA